LGWVGIRPTSRALLLFEVVACLLILSLVVAIAVELADGSAPRGQSFSLDVLRLPPGVPVSTVALAATSGFLAFAGFESTGTLGEESSHPRRAIPRSMVTAIAVGAVFYVLCMCAQTLGFGTDALGVRTFADASTPLSDLAHSYVGQPLADVLDVGAALSAVGAGLGCAVVGTRMLLTFGRIGVVPPLAAIPADAPRRALAVELAITLSLLTSLRLVGLTAQHVFFYLATLGVLSLLVMYAITNVAAAQHLARGHGLRGVLLPVAGVLVAGYVLYRNVWPVPDPPFNAFPYLVAGWLALGALLAFATRWHFAAALHAGHDPAPHAVPKPRHSSLEPARVGDTDSRRPPRRA
jgi:amino acid transporter